MRTPTPVIAILFTIGSAIQAQPVHFDAASIKPGRGEGRAGNLQFTPGRIVGTNVSARQLLMEAYRLKSVTYGDLDLQKEPLKLDGPAFWDIIVRLAPKD